MALINTKGLAFFGPGSEWFWAALQFTALAITFIAIYRQLQSARSSRAVEQVEGYRRQLDGEPMARYQLAILVALRDRQEIPGAAGRTIGNYFETLGSLSRKGHVDTNLLWNTVSFPTLIWGPVNEDVRTGSGAWHGAGVQAAAGEGTSSEDTLRVMVVMGVRVLSVWIASLRVIAVPYDCAFPPPWRAEQQVGALMAPRI